MPVAPSAPPAPVNFGSVATMAVAGRHMFRNAMDNSSQPTGSAGAGAGAGSGGGGLVEKLQSLSELRKQGILSEAEFEQAKQRVLSGQPA